MSTHCERVLALLSDGKPHTHHELYALHVIAHSRVADLRKRLRPQGQDIAQWHDRESGDYIYQLVSLDPGGGARRPPLLPPGSSESLTGEGAYAAEVRGLPNLSNSPPSPVSEHLVAGRDEALTADPTPSRPLAQQLRLDGEAA